jgi:protein-S-isoprenylcysteine O-methyltransferase Ste14
VFKPLEVVAQLESSATVSFEEKLRRKITWYRVPLMALATVALVGFLHREAAFWYGAPVAVFGELIQVWATSHLHKDERLTISGPYSHVRNPMYIGRFFLGLGFFIMTWSPYAVAGYVVLFAIYAHMRVVREEARLKQIFAPAYQYYCDEIRRWLPRLRPYSRSESRRASWTQVCANHEQIVLIGVLVVLALVYIRIDRFGYWHWLR